MNTLLDQNGKILVPGIMDDVQPLTNEELELYKDIDFDVEAYREELGTNQLLYSKKVNKEWFSVIEIFFQIILSTDNTKTDEF